MSESIKVSNFIDGQKQIFTNSQSCFSFKGPYSESPSYQVVNSSQLDLVKALQGAHKAFNEWKDSSREERIKVIDQIQSQIELNKYRYAEIEAWDQGLGVNFVCKASYEVGLARLKLYKDEMNKLSSDMQAPLGVVGVILSWNLSTRLFIDYVIPALLAGNAVIVKLSSISPSTSLVWSEILSQLKLPQGLVQIMHSQDVQFKKLLLSHPSIKAVVFTGHLENSAKVLKSVSEVGLQQFKKIQMHTGTKNTAAVLKDLSEQEMNDVFESFLQGQGQLAWNSARLFILEKNEKLWTDYLQEKLNQLRPADSIYEDSLWTPLARPSYVEAFHSIKTQARQDHAKLITSLNATQQLKENYVYPFFTKDMSNCSTLQQDQVFGPAFILSVVKYGFDIPKYSNVSYFGHSANVWTEADKNLKVLGGLEVGLVSLNKWSIYQVDEAIGVKQSSYGDPDRKIFGTFFSNVKKIIT